MTTRACRMRGADRFPRPSRCTQPRRPRRRQRPMREPPGPIASCTRTPANSRTRCDRRARVRTPSSPSTRTAISPWSGAFSAVLQAGSAILVLDPAHPAARHRQCLEDARPGVLLLLEEAGDPAARGAGSRTSHGRERHNAPPSRGRRARALPRLPRDTARGEHRSRQSGLPHLHLRIDRTPQGCARMPWFAHPLPAVSRAHLRFRPVRPRLGALGPRSRSAPTRPLYPAALRRCGVCSRSGGPRPDPARSLDGPGADHRGVFDPGHGAASHRTARRRPHRGFHTSHPAPDLPARRAGDPTRRTPAARDRSGGHRD